MNETVTLRDHLELRIKALEEKTDAAFEAHDVARVLQAREYERRLDALNHEHARVAAIQYQSVTKEKFEDYAKQNQTALDVALLRANEKIEAISRLVNSMDARKHGGSDVWKMLAGAAVVGAAVAGVIISLLK